MTRTSGQAGRQAPGRLRRVDLVLDVALALEACGQVADRRVELRGAGATTWLRIGSGFGEGWLVRERRDVVAHLDRHPEPLEALLGQGRLGDEPLRLAGLLEHRPVLDELALDDGPPLARPGQDVAIALELDQRGLALLDHAGRPADGLLGDLEAAGVLVAAARQVLDAPGRASSWRPTSPGRRR